MNLYDHQDEGATWLADRQRAALLDEQGLGKTITVIEAANRIRFTHTGARTKLPGGWRSIVVCPSVVLWNWVREWSTWSTFDDYCHVVERLDDQICRNANLVVISHRALLEPRIYKQVASRTWNLAVLDESQFFRNPEAARTVAFYGFGMKKAKPLTARAKRVWCLTGTPAPNDVRDLYTMCIGLWPSRFSAPTNSRRPMTYDEFEERYCVTEPTRYGNKAVGNLNVEELRARLQGVTLRRLEKECLNLPAMRHETVVLTPKVLPQKLELLEREIGPKLRELLTETDDVERAFRLLGEHKQFSTWRRLLGLAKVKAVLELLEMEHHDKLVIFAHHTDVIDVLHEKLPNSVTITGATSPTQRQKAVDQFQGNPEVKFAICQIKAGGIGITLTAAREVLLVEQSYVPGDNDQAIKRIHRIGQKNTCRARFVALANTGDEHVVSVLRRKVQMIQELLA